MAVKKEKKLTRREKRFVDEMAKPTTKSNAEAARKAGYSEKSAKYIARENSTKPYLQAAIEQRRKEIIEYHGMTAEEVFGQVIRQMHSTVDDILDEQGFVSIDKARETGAIHLIKEVTQKDTPHGRQITVKMYPADEARTEIASYLGLKQQDAPNKSTLETVAQAIKDHLREYPDHPVEEVVRIFAEKGKVDVMEVGKLVN